MTGPDADLFLLGSNGFLRVNVVEGFDYENPTDANADNIYELVLTATETKSGGLQRVQDFHIQVSDLKDTFTLGGTIFSGINTVLDGDVVVAALAIVIIVVVGVITNSSRGISIISADSTY